MPDHLHKTSFQADGPALEGFVTAGPNIQIGARALGQKCGVLGRNKTFTPSLKPQGPNENGAGVFGAGDTGVRGFGEQGVVGEVTRRPAGPAHPKGAGVTGIAYEMNQIGVLGVQKKGIQPQRGHGVGVMGASQAREGAGVVGISVNKADERMEHDAAADGQGTGVLGSSGNGVGVLGTSKTGRGGGFHSEGAAQIRLMPLQSGGTPHPPPGGLTGDVVVVQQASEDAQLWFCISGRGGKARWGRVAFETIGVF